MVEEVLTLFGVPFFTFEMGWQKQKMSIDEIFEFGRMSAIPSREANITFKTMYDIWLLHVKSGLTLLGVEWWGYVSGKIIILVQHCGQSAAVDS